MVADVRLEEYKSWHICSTIDFKGHTGQYFGTSDCTVGEILNLERVDKYGYEGWIEKDKIIIVQKKKSI
ncbi:MAG: hypothetical protein E7222_06290 [Clostridiales bacterium]|nr:hypothetical protein [Clostridiales bacterium]